MVFKWGFVSKCTECFAFVVIIFLPIFELKLQRITLAGYDFTLSEKNFTGNHLNLSAADKVNGDANRNHYLLITKGAGCGDVWIKGFYGFEHDEPDADW
ncbi:uncharacterized protein S100072_01905 [Bacillus velezensis]|nr:uncharacterized protein S100072_01905 [Bacillus velezensis]